MRSAVFAMFSASAGFVIALPGQVVKRQLPTSTITVEAHPMTFWPLAPLAATATPLSYASPPSPIRVPPGLHINAQTPPHSECTPTSPSRVTPPFPLSPTLPHPTAPPDSAPTCTKIQGAYPVSTLPSFCRPTLFANAPAFASAPAASPAAATATVTLGANSLADKVSCCAACAGYYNCLAWRFVPSYTGPPSDRLPGGFDPWRHGSCEVVYHTGDSSGGDGLPALCPNGRLSGALDGTANPGQEPWFEGLYYNGWNLGACGDLGGVLFQGGKDAGVGDLGALCSGG
ncbi:hypothetical protein GGS24DRAFT_349440 [Hypoxylon argillaceum]|nr:hypothetical protein GGS24DRAFT_349440 [Hypoxylon argillaceum]